MTALKVELGVADLLLTCMPIVAVLLEFVVAVSEGEGVSVDVVLEIEVVFWGAVVVFKDFVAVGMGRVEVREGSAEGSVCQSGPAHAILAGIIPTNSAKKTAKIATIFVFLVILSRPLEGPMAI